eukprot:14181061-Ditylum_brightwellii.AAC.1
MKLSYLKDRSHEILWTPPYCPSLQPIETYWACGKNHSSFNSFDGINMKDTIKLLHEGISGSIGGLIIDDDYITEDVILPIDTLVVNLTSEVNDNNRNWVGEDNFSGSV